MRARGNCCDYSIQQDADCGGANICPLLFGEHREGERRLQGRSWLSLQRGRGRRWGWRRWRSQEMAGGKQRTPVGVLGGHRGVFVPRGMPAPPWCVGFVMGQRGSGFLEGRGALAWQGEVHRGWGCGCGAGTGAAGWVLQAGWVLVGLGTWDWGWLDPAPSTVPVSARSLQAVTLEAAICQPLKAAGTACAWRRRLLVGKGWRP